MVWGVTFMGQTELAAIEYWSLRDEILSHQRLIWQALTFAATTCLILLSYSYSLYVDAITSDGEPGIESIGILILAMLPWLIIMGSLQLVTITRREIFEMGAYIHLFYETGSENPLYERRLDKKRDKEGPGRESHTGLAKVIYWSLAILTCVSSTFYVVDFTLCGRLCAGSFLAIVLPCVGLTILLLVRLRKFADVPSAASRIRYRKEWMDAGERLRKQR